MAAKGGWKRYESLLYGLRRGEVGFDVVYRELWGYLLQVARAAWRKRPVALRLSPDDAEDVAQRLALRVWRAVDEWDPSRNPDLVDHVGWCVSQERTDAIRKATGYGNGTRKPGRPLGVSLRLAGLDECAGLLLGHRGEAARQRSPFHAVEVSPTCTKEVAEVEEERLRVLSEELSPESWGLVQRLAASRGSPGEWLTHRGSQKLRAELRRLGGRAA